MVTGWTAELDGNDIRSALQGCLIEGTLLSGGRTFRCARLDPGSYDLFIILIN